MINFPDSPAVNQQFSAAGSTYMWDGYKWLPSSSANILSLVSVSDTAPTSPSVGQAWWDSVGAQAYVWMNDGTSTQWVPLSNLTGFITSLAAGAGITLTPSPLSGGSGTVALTAPVTVANGGTGHQATPVSLQTATAVSSSITTANTDIMFGLAITFTPATTGKVLAHVSSTVNCANAASVMILRLRYGTGTAPVFGAAAAGTIVYGQQYYNSAASGGTNIGFTLVSILTLTPGTAYWLDVSGNINNTGGMTLSTGVAVIQEMAI